MSEQTPEQAAAGPPKSILHETFEPLPDPRAETPDTFKSDREGIKAAAAEMQRKRQEEEIVDRSYVDLATGERLPETKTVKLERAAHDLAQLRMQEAHQAEENLKAGIANEVDHFRAQELGVEIPSQPLPQQEQSYEQHEQQPELAPELEPQPVLEGDDLSPEGSELARRLGNDPELLAMIEGDHARRVAEAEQVKQQATRIAEAAQQTWSQAAAKAAFDAQSVFIASVPELHSATTQEVVNDRMARLQQQNPQRFQEIQNLATRAQQAQQHALAAEQMRQTQATHQFNEWGKSQDAEFEKAFRGNPEQKSRLQKEAVAMLREQGLSDEDLSYHWNNNALLRSVAGQRILADAAAYRLAQRSAARPAPKPVPRVQRPGTQDRHVTGSERYASQRLSAAEAEARDNPNPKTMAAVLAARRAAAAR